jgi:hypothetical protein
MRVMEFEGVINKVTLVAKKEGDMIRDYLQIQVMVPVNQGDEISHFAGLFREAARFSVERYQGEMAFNPPPDRKRGVPHATE